jgi:uncharacterized protein YeaO (DUF488 family)
MKIINGREPLRRHTSFAKRNDPPGTIAMMIDIRIKRVYDPVEPDDGFRVLVDRLWPRGLTKAKVRADLWLKEAAPGTILRKWFGHDRSKWNEFRTRYLAELSGAPDVADRLLDEAKTGRGVTLLYAARDTECNHAVVLREYLLGRLGIGEGPRESP